MTKAGVFWKWFVRHEDDLLHFERNQETIFDALAAALQKVDPDLTFESTCCSTGRSVSTMWRPRSP
jgi:hypothetical protein